MCVRSGEVTAVNEDGGGLDGCFRKVVVVLVRKQRDDRLFRRDVTTHNYTEN